MTARFTNGLWPLIDTPLASAVSWAGRRIEGIAKRQAAYDGVPRIPGTAAETAAEREAQIESIWRGNRARRDAAAQAYGEPETPHEFYRGRPGAQAEKIVLDCLRALQALRAPDDLYAHALIVTISDGYLTTSPDGRTEVRRASALLRIAGEMR
jgi:hypothetical protein